MIPLPKDNKNYTYGKMLRWPWHYGITEEPGARPHFSLTLYRDFINVTFILWGRRRTLEVFNK